MSRSTLVFVICLVIVAGGLGYYFFFFNSDTSGAVTTNAGTASDAELSFITLVSKLDPIVFDTSVLSDPRFTSRENIRTAIVPEASGRKDPFAPIGR
ncbi:MAG TPA: hypothetical protein VN086_02915 [Candidatus Paceibacterota bacterium]|nr:hypothetical protein [Candidatus Paceibacterota bacterium]